MPNTPSIGKQQLARSGGLIALILFQNADRVFDTLKAPDETPRDRIPATRFP
jgi:hypothetical protein